MMSAMPVAARPLVRNTLEAVATMRFLVSAVSILDFLILLPFLQKNVLRLLEA
jgi:hypothetical protein